MAEPLKPLNLLVVITLVLSVSSLIVCLLYGLIQASDLKEYCTILFEVVILITMVVCTMEFIHWIIRNPPKKINSTSLVKGLHITALVSLVVVFVVVVAPTVAPTSLSWLIQTYEESTLSDDLAVGEDTVAPPENSTDSNGLLTAAATIMGLAVFGSALGTLVSNKHLIKGIAYTLIPTIVVQAAFMLHLVGILYFPVAVWIVMTAILLMLAVLAMTASKITSTGTDGDGPAPNA